MKNPMINPSIHPVRLFIYSSVPVFIHLNIKCKCHQPSFIYSPTVHPSINPFIHPFINYINCTIHPTSHTVSHPSIHLFIHPLITHPVHPSGTFICPRIHSTPTQQQINPSIHLSMLMITVYICMSMIWLGSGIWTIWMWKPYPGFRNLDQPLTWLEYSYTAGCQ